MGLVHRLERRVGGVRAGSSGFVYSLSAKGQRTLRVGASAGSPRRRRWEPSAVFADHILAVTELYVRLVEAERRGELSIDRFEAEPRCWRSFSGRGGERVVLKPDAFAVVSKGDEQFLSFVEVDLGSEGSAALRRKVDTYLAHARTGEEQTRHQVYPRVVFLAPDTRRVERIRDALKSTLRAIPELCAIGQLDDSVAFLSGPKA